MEFKGFIISSILFALLAYCLTLYRRRKLPPGPIALPIVGNLFDIGPKPHQSLAKLAQKHGPLMTIRLGCITSIVASSADMAREILQKNDEACSGRVVPDAVTALEDNHLAVLWISAGEEWRIIRRTLNTFLTNPKKLEMLKDLRHKAVEEMVKHVMVCSEKGLVLDIGKLAFATALNQMSSTCISENVDDLESKDVRGFLSAVKTLMVVDGKFNIADIFPWLKPFDPQSIRRRAKAAYGWFDNIIEGYINRRLKQRESTGEKRHGDLLDSLLDYSEENKSEFNLKHIKVLLVDLFLAGTETSSNTTEWAMTELILNPRIMEKVREEVVESTRTKGSVEEADVLELPYLQAVVKETMRLHLAVPLLVPHKTETNVKINGYMIPKNTQVLVNAWAIARDAEYWDNPTSFMPERFMNSELDFKGQHFSFLPFGSGRRMCPGILLAQRVVSMMVATLIYYFDWKLPKGTKTLDMNDTFGLTLQRSTPLLAVPTSLKSQAKSK